MRYESKDDVGSGGDGVVEKRLNYLLNSDIKNKNTKTRDVGFWMAKTETAAGLKGSSFVQK